MMLGSVVEDRHCSLHSNKSVFGDEFSESHKGFEDHLLRVRHGNVIVEVVSHVAVLFQDVVGPPKHLLKLSPTARLALAQVFLDAHAAELGPSQSSEDNVIVRKANK